MLTRLKPQRNIMISQYIKILGTHSITISFSNAEQHNMLTLPVQLISLVFFKEINIVPLFCPLFPVIVWSF